MFILELIEVKGLFVRLLAVLPPVAYLATDSVFLLMLRFYAAKA